jgi:S1-C subfamily serine protease
VAKEVIEYLAKRQEPLTHTLKPSTHVESVPKETRKVSLGIIPDFTYSGKGCRLSGVVPGSPAESSGLKEGDVIVKIGSKPVHNLRDLSSVLKSLDPGDRISITFLRAEREMSTETAVMMR